MRFFLRKLKEGNQMKWSWLLTLQIGELIWITTQTWWSIDWDLSNRSSCINAFSYFHLKTETDPVFEMLCSVQNTRWWTNARNVVILSEMFSNLVSVWFMTVIVKFCSSLEKCFFLHILSKLNTHLMYLRLVLHFETTRSQYRLTLTVPTVKFLSMNAFMASVCLRTTGLWYGTPPLYSPRIELLHYLLTPWDSNYRR
jgi:hypothetical protein